MASDKGNELATILSKNKKIKTIEKSRYSGVGHYYDMMYHFRCLLITRPAKEQVHALFSEVGENGAAMLEQDVLDSGLTAELLRQEHSIYA